jgi:hypothetical protein
VLHNTVYTIELNTNGVACLPLIADIPASSWSQIAAARRVLPEWQQEDSAKSQSFVMRTAASSPAEPSGSCVMHLYMGGMGMTEYSHVSMPRVNVKQPLASQPCVR